MDELKIILKQHTPYIHFQHNHFGATLRASDLKPKIDKYLGLTQNKHPRYQLTVTSNMVNEYPKNTMPGKEPYFGKHKLCCYNNIELRFNTYFDSELKDKIEKILPEVFACENFGSFGSKGYGCFTDENQSQTDFENILKKEYGNGSKKIYYWVTNKTKPEDISFQIKYFYSLLKSGINVRGREDTDPKTYYKSLLMSYFKDKKYDSTKSIRWEKRGLKKNFGLSKRRKDTYLDDGGNSIPSGEDYYAVKPLLGYSESQEWQSYGLKIDRENPANSNPIEISFPDPDNIKRIPSPIFFKVFKDSKNTRVYFMLRNEDKFQDNIYGNTKEYTFNINGKLPAKFLAPDTFDYPKFLQYAVTEITKIKSNGATGGTAGRVDNFIRHLTTTKIQQL